jgi:hypothetical protein
MRRPPNSLSVNESGQTGLTEDHEMILTECDMTLRKSWNWVGRVLFVALISSSFLVQSCKEEQTVEFDISGYCYDTCSGTALVHYKVQHNKAGSEYETFTDSGGYFQLKGYFTEIASTAKPAHPGSIVFRDTTEQSLCCSSFWIRGDSKFANDTIYAYHRVKSILFVNNITGTSTNSSDTLFLMINGLKEYDGTEVPTFRSYTADYDVVYHKYYVGPFYHNQILDTVWTMLPPHVGFINNKVACSFRLLGPNGIDGYLWGRYSFVKGQRNEICGNYHSIEVDLRN